MSAHISSLSNLADRTRSIADLKKEMRRKNKKEKKEKKHTHTSCLRKRNTRQEAGSSLYLRDLKQTDSAQNYNLLPLSKNISYFPESHLFTSDPECVEQQLVRRHSCSPQQLTVSREREREIERGGKKEKKCGLLKYNT